MFLLSLLCLDASAIQAPDADTAPACDEFLLSTTLPAEGARDVPIDARLVLVFSGFGTCFSNAFDVTVSTDDGVVFEGTVLADRETGLATVTPEADLAPDTLHVLDIGPQDSDEHAWTSTFTTGSDRVTPIEVAPSLTLQGLDAWTSDGLWSYSAYWIGHAEVGPEDLALVHVYGTWNQEQPLTTSLPGQGDYLDLYAAWSAVGADELCFVATIEDGRGEESAVSDPVCGAVQTHDTRSGRGCQAAPVGGGLLGLLFALAAPLHRRRRQGTAALPGATTR